MKLEIMAQLLEKNAEVLGSCVQLQELRYSGLSIRVTQPWLFETDSDFQKIYRTQRER